MAGPNRLPLLQLSRRLTLALILAALALMFLASFAYRLSHPSLVKPENRLEESGAGEQAGGGMSGPSADSMRHIAELMTRLSAEPESYDLRLELAEHFMDGADWKSAAAMLNKAAELRPLAVQPRIYLGYCLFNLEDYRGAAGHYEQALALEYDATAKVNLAYIYKNFLDMEAVAAKLFDEVIADPATAEDLRRVARDLGAVPE
jgi:tetratricopeptide (TPR) repeat protein